MKSLLFAGILSLTLHGALLLATFGSLPQKLPCPIQQVIYVALHGLQDREAMHPHNPSSAQENNVPSHRTAAQPDNGQKQFVAPRKKIRVTTTQSETVSKMPETPPKETPLGSISSLASAQIEPAPASALPLPATADSGIESTATEASPLYRKNPPPDYPFLARQRGLEGTVILDVLVSKVGTANQIRVATTSGYELLDQAAVTAVGNWVFQPGKRGEQPVDMWVRIPIRFALQD